MSDVDVAVDVARSAFESGLLANPRNRSRLLRGFAHAAESDQHSLIRLAKEETGLSLDRLTQELARATRQLLYLSECIDGEDAFRRSTTSHPQNQAGLAPQFESRLVPLGVVAVFTASNFPFAFSVLGGDVASALAAGCSVVVKSHPGHPRTAVRCFELFEMAAGECSGYVTHLSRPDAGVELVEHPKVDAIGFTGSVSGGVALMQASHKRPRPIPFFGELGSVNPVVITPAAARARPRVIARELGREVLASWGQLCTKPSVVWVPANEGGAELTDELKSLINGHHPERLLTEKVEAHYCSRSAELRVAAALEPHSQLESQVIEFSTESLPDAALDECFGPSIVVAWYQPDSDDLRASIRRLHGALVGAVHTSGADDPHAELCLAVVSSKVGRLVWNGPTTGVAIADQMHHGGPWPSSTPGNGTAVGARAIERWTRTLVLQDVPPKLRSAVFMAVAGRTTP